MLQTFVGVGKIVDQSSALLFSDMLYYHSCIIKHVRLAPFFLQRSVIALEPSFRRSFFLLYKQQRRIQIYVSRNFQVPSLDPTEAESLRYTSRSTGTVSTNRLSRGNQGTKNHVSLLVCEFAYVCVCEKKKKKNWEYNFLDVAFDY